MVVLAFDMWREAQQRIAKYGYLAFALIYHVAQFFEGTISDLSNILNIFKIPQIILLFLGGATSLITKSLLFA